MRQVNIHITAKPDKDSSSSGFAISERVREFIMFICTFKYKPEDVECIYCLHFQHHRCLMDDGCPYIAERIEAGAIDYDALISDTFRSPTGILRRRLHQLITHFNGSLWEDNSHAQRFSQTLREIGYYRKADAPRYYAALYLLTSSDEIWRRAYNAFLPERMERSYVNMYGISIRDYALVQAAASIYNGTEQFALSDLNDFEAVDDVAFRLVINAILIARYGAKLFQAINGDTPAF